MKNKGYVVMSFAIFFLLALSLGCARKHSVQVLGETMTLSYRVPGADKVFFASSVDNFQYHPAIRGPGNRWQVTIPRTDEFSYFYIVDGVVTLPECLDTVLDDFGAKNCFYAHEM